MLFNLQNPSGDSWTVQLGFCIMYQIHLWEINKLCPSGWCLAVVKLHFSGTGIMTNCSVVCPGVPLSSMFSDYSCAVEVEGTILSTFPLLSIAQVETESFLCVQSIVPCSFFYEIYVFSFCPLMYREIQLLTTQTFLRYKRFFLKN